MNITHSRHLARLSAAAVLGAATAVAAIPAANAAGDSAVTGGKTYVIPTAAVAKALHAKHIAVSGTGSARYTSIDGAKTLVLPIKGGTATPPDYVTRLGGGVKLKLRSHVVTLTGIVFDTKTHKATASVDHGKRLAVFKLGDPQEGAGGPGEVVFGDYTVTLTKAGWKKIDTKLHTQFFAHHPRIGTGTTDVKFT
ncbi:MAG TPA: hypothetical protein VFE15_14840 [Marmoricola sp.]|jgi:hypothetical protein|nr:hypothetical protein [Marmoricola sp.]